jgi:hypothetical protein
MPDRATAERLAGDCPRGWRAIVTQACDRSMLLDRLHGGQATR